MEALVVGGAGTTGRGVVAALIDRGYRVSILHRGLHDPDLPDSVECILADPHWPEELETAFEGRRFDLAIILYGRLRHVADALVGKVSRVISVGGALPIYKGWMRITEKNPFECMEPTPVLLGEHHPLSTAEGVDNFSVQVRRTEEALMQAHRSGNFEVTHLRYPIVYGPHQIAAPEWGLVRRAREGRRRVILPGSGMTLLSRGYGDNMVHALMLAIDHPREASGQIFNVADDRILYNREWVEIVSDALGVQFEIVDIPFDMLPHGFRAAPPQLLYRHHCVMDTGKLRSLLGYRDVVPAEEALQRTVEWYLANPLPPNGEIEKNIGDPYDYAYEDALIDIYRSHRDAALREMNARPAVDVVWRHPYPHPKKRGDIR